MFEININNSIIDGRLFYKKSEYSFFFTPHKNTDISLLINYLQLNFNSIDHRLYSIDGFHAYTNWEKRNLILPKCVLGELYLNDDLESGDVKRIINNAPTFFDEEKQIVCVGSIEQDGSVSVKVSSDIIVSIKDNDITSLWLSPTITI